MTDQKQSEKTDGNASSRPFFYDDEITIRRVTGDDRKADRPPEGSGNARHHIDPADHKI